MKETDILRAIAASPSLKLNGGTVSNDLVSNDGKASYSRSTPDRYIVTLTPEIMKALQDFIE